MLPFLSPVVHAQEWEFQVSGTEHNLRDVFFLDHNNGWAIGDSATIIHTNNGGQTWRQQSSPVDSLTLNKIQFLDTQAGYIVGDSGTILSTKNGGQNWKLDSSNVDDNLIALSFVNADTGWVAGYFHSSSNPDLRRGIVMQTRDGGLHWEIIWNTMDLLGYYSPPLIGNIEFTNKDTGFAVLVPLYIDSGPALVFRTTDGGQNWDSLSATPGHGRKYSLQVFGDTLWVYSYQPNISTNGGLDWQLITNVPGSFISMAEMDFLNGHTGLILGYALEGSAISVTVDAGSSWTSILSNQKPWIHSISALDANEIWAVGDSGTVMHYSTALAIESSEDKGLPFKYELLQNHPNPFNPSTTLRFETPRQGRVELIVYDLRGREVVRLLDRDMPPGYFDVIWNGQTATGAPVASGMYFTRMHATSTAGVAPGYSRTIKMLLLK